MFSSFVSTLFLAVCLQPNISLKVTSHSFNQSEDNCKTLDIFDDKGSVIHQTRAHCLICNFAEQRCVELFTTLVEENLARFSQLSMPLQEEIIAFQNKDRKLRVLLNSGPLLSQIDNFCSSQNAITQR